MIDAQRFKLRFGPYKTPRFKYGKIVQCEVWGDVKIVGLTDGRIPWPLGRPPGKGGRPSLIVYRGLAKAVRRESRQAICHWWGAAGDTVRKWRRALGVPLSNEGTSRLRSAYSREDWAVNARKKAQTKARDPQRRAKIAAARRGKKRPTHVIEALRRAHLGKPTSEETRRKQSESHKRRGTRPPWLNAPWTPEEEELCRTRPASEVANLTGRTLWAVYHRRRQLGVRGGRRR